MKVKEKYLNCLVYKSILPEVFFLVSETVVDCHQSPICFCVILNRHITPLIMNRWNDTWNDYEEKQILIE
jgi:hypothetical protein